MVLQKMIVFQLVLMLVISGCGNTSSGVTGNPTPKDYLKNENADIFELDGIVYSNAEDVDWVNDTDYRIGEEEGEITEQNSSAGGFEHGTANKLPVGTTIYQTDTQVYVAVVDEKKIPYMKMVEG
ncbi:hypothetical protein D7Z54_07315 [Salibacterium salarium]|uniref:Lipoprotein n=1 Tax=Salibacterium salarium TaxID=284579 RepID=A0A428N677_9BACI|nr:hypothetical protein [Salibacterium salarium]RSL33921.1 hypothetical protein D7Z54_07315 [Salibacterium salarium]